MGKSKVYLNKEVNYTELDQDSTKTLLKLPIFW